MSEMIRIYSLREDEATISAVQEATLTSTEYGLEPEPAVFGSDEWWEAVDRGRLSTHTIEGVISSVIWGSMGDWPEFEVTSCGGESTIWTRRGDHTRYVEGLRTKISYVVQHHRAESLYGAQEFRQILEIWVEECPRRTEAKAPGPNEVLRRRTNRALEMEAL